MNKLGLVVHKSMQDMKFVLAIKEAMESQGATVKLLSRKSGKTPCVEIPTQEPMSVYKQYHSLNQIGLCFVPYVFSKIEAFGQLMSDGTIIGRKDKIKAEIHTEEELLEYDYFSPVYLGSKEYRLHFVENKLISCQEKKKKKGVAQTSDFIKTLEHGYVYCDVPVPKQIDADLLGIRMYNYLMRKFCAVDVIVEANGATRISEVFSFPVIKGKTALKYLEAFKERSETSSNVPAAYEELLKEYGNAYMPKETKAKPIHHQIAGKQFLAVITPATSAEIVWNTSVTYDEFVKSFESEDNV